MSLDLALRDSVEASLYGLVIIIDLQYATLRHVAQVRPSILMNMVHAWQGCYPIRIRLLNYVNTPESAKLILMFTRYFLNDKLKQRLHIYTPKTTRECFTNVPANILPVEYGGTDGTIQELTGNSYAEDFI